MCGEAPYRDIPVAEPTQRYLSVRVGERFSDCALAGPRYGRETAIFVNGLFLMKRATPHTIAEVSRGQAKLDLTIGLVPLNGHYASSSPFRVAGVITAYR
jgi:hypothetical protein